MVIVQRLEELTENQLELLFKEILDAFFANAQFKLTDLENFVLPKDVQDFLCRQLLDKRAEFLCKKRTPEEIEACSKELFHRLSLIFSAFLKY